VAEDRVHGGELVFHPVPKLIDHDHVVDKMVAKYGAIYAPYTIPTTDVTYLVFVVEQEVAAATVFGRPSLMGMSPGII